MSTSNTAEQATWSWWQVLDRVSTLAVIAASAMFAWNIHAGASQRVRTPTSQASPPVPRDPIALASSPSVGVETAKVAVVEFSDFQCPFCGQFERDVLPGLKAQYVDTGLVRVFFRHNPLPMHPRAQRAAEAAECANRQGSFWQMHDWLFGHPSTLEDRDMNSGAKGMNLNMEAFQACMDSEPAGAIGRDVQLAKTLSLSGTPAFLVGRIVDNKHVTVSSIMLGARPLSEFQVVLNRLTKG
jgi:protein-disulfide isomerase